MKGRKNPDNDWSPELGLAILRARAPVYAALGYDVNGLEIIAAFQGVSRSRAQQQVDQILRKLRVRLHWPLKKLGLELHEALQLINGNGA